MILPFCYSAMKLCILMNLSPEWLVINKFLSQPEIISMRRELTITIKDIIRRKRFTCDTQDEIMKLVECYV